MRRWGSGSYCAQVLIRDAEDRDWPLIYPFFAQIVAEGKTYAFPDGLSLDEARGWWLEEPPGRTVVAVDGPVVLGSAKMGPNRRGVVRTWRRPASWSIHSTGAVESGGRWVRTSWSGRAK